MTMNYMMYSRSHFVKGMELMVLLICSLIQDSESLPLVPTTKMFLRRFIQAAQASHKVVPDMEMEFLANQVINVFT
ncbi:hypothetical protein ISN45_Aa04g004500 [Arabidopsis thaliana x Arabidopsis arenosa]|uniref:Uncharacterized protein n=2 Tax=Arabidopsis TaxID=3701 RepID=A0A8T2A4N1_9BRAS|nr:hypothetical protein ISN44_As13g007520 [Arabidopsis suecica]KAG7536826.1 hypothetical protein ISN44_As13g007520 [Arabidopsis suecica]KAG7567589.1 hypothetical protein ISN45_Aa04g004500 [Arabidopsis thaliana x Arabidopsis arenosa]KAG7567590.1 hypothetical protein ISN45_Aa04g004500 [Arabidopsis thaliana x Arabidopsis arenosa]